MDREWIGSARRERDSGRLQAAIAELASGGLSRRQFVARALALGASAGVIGTVLEACGGTSAPASTSTGATAGGAAPVRGGMLTMARSADADNLDPYYTVEDQGIFVDLQIFNRLVGISPGANKTIVPELATSWSYSGDGETLTLKLLQGVTYSDSTSLTADDVVFCLNRAFDPNSDWGFLFGPVTSNWPKPGGSATAVDASTVAIKLTAPFAPLLAALATFAASIYPKANYAKWGKNMSAHPVGTGPFMLDSWTHGTQLTLVKNPHYRVPGSPYLDKVVFNVVSDDSARALQLQGGQVDVIDQVTAPLTGALKSANLPIVQVPGGQLMFVRFNYKHAPYTDVNVRLALAWAADRQRMAKDIYFGYGQPADSIVLPSCFYYAGGANVDPPGFDLTKAKAYLAKSSVPHGFSDTLLYLANDSAYNSAMQIWAADLAQIGIHLKLVPTESAQLGSIIYGSNWRMGGLYFTPDTPDPDEILGLVDYAVANAIHTYFHDQTLHNEIGAAREDLNAQSRAQDYVAIQKRVNDVAATINFITQPRMYATTSKVQGFQPNCQGRYYFEKVWLSS